jgi:hypothetical protein
MRRLPHQGADHGTVDHGFLSDGVFLLLHERVLPSRWLISLRRSSSSLSSLWMAFWCEWLSLLSNGGAQAFRVQDPSGARKTGPNRPPEWAGSAGLGPPRPGSVAPFAPLGPYAFMYFAPSTCMILMMLSSRPTWRFSSHEVRSFTLQSPGVFLVALRSLPPLEVISSSSWTRTRLCKCSFELVANPSFMSMFSYINTTLPNACTQMNLLYD